MGVPLNGYTIRPECENHSIQLIVVILKHIVQKSAAEKSSFYVTIEHND
jgi:hypothetical protein